MWTRTWLVLEQTKKRRQNVRARKSLEPWPAYNSEHVRPMIGCSVQISCWRFARYVSYIGLPTYLNKLR